MANNLIHCQNVLKAKETHEQRLCTIYGWVKSDNINYKQFKLLLDYLEQIEEIKDFEFIEHNKGGKNEP